MNVAEPQWVARPEEVVEVSFRVPLGASEALSAMARYLEVPPDVLLRRYTGAGLREDQARYFSEQALTTVEDVLRANGADDLFVETVMRQAKSALMRRANPRFRTTPDAEPENDRPARSSTNSQPK